MKDLVAREFDEAAAALAGVAADHDTADQIVRAAEAIHSSIAGGGKVVTFGNGGSMADAMHLAEELTGKFRNDRRPFPAVAVSDPAYITCCANEYGFDSVFERYVAAHARPQDTVVGFSTSGASANVVAGLAAARVAGASTVLLTGRGGSHASAHADTTIVTPGGAYADRVQELHVLVVHVLVHLVETLQNRP